MKRLLWLLIALPLLLLLVVFSVNNRAAVALDLWPLRYEIALPLFLVVLGSLAVGVLLGLFLEWVFEGRNRSALRSERRRTAATERELSKLRQAEAERAARAPQGERPAEGPRPALPAPASPALPGNSNR
ncbi:MAG: LapA family protein [Tistlia sp.]|uniref:LapA family protein n=1 Tax=Tistlia sp. TaxID=3057121 RepID=UPI0034A30848